MSLVTFFLDFLGRSFRNVIVIFLKKYKCEKVNGFRTRDFKFLNDIGEGQFQLFSIFRLSCTKRRLTCFGSFFEIIFYVYFGVV